MVGIRSTSGGPGAATQSDGTRARGHPSNAAEGGGVVGPGGHGQQARRVAAGGGAPVGGRVRCIAMTNSLNRGDRRRSLDIQIECGSGTAPHFWEIFGRGAIESFESAAPPPPNHLSSAKKNYHQNEAAQLRWVGSGERRVMGTFGVLSGGGSGPTFQECEKAGEDIPSE